MDCPFAWRTRLCACEKGVRFEYIAFDAPEPDARAALRNPERRSPLLVHGAVRLTESGVIALYIEEAFPGRPLLPGGAAERARQRIDALELSKLEVDPHTELTPEARAGVLAGYERLERKLADGRSWLGGQDPTLVDLLLWPHLIGLRRPLQLPASAGLARVAAYLGRVEARPSLLETRPAWAH